MPSSLDDEPDHVNELELGVVVSYHYFFDFIYDLLFSFDQYFADLLAHHSTVGLPIFAEASPVPTPAGDMDDEDEDEGGDEDDDEQGRDHREFHNSDCPSSATSLTLRMAGGQVPTILGQEPHLRAGLRRNAPI